MTRWVITVGGALLALLWLLSSLYVVDQTEYAIQLRFGDPVRTLLQPGLHLKLPWPVDTVARLDNRLMVLQNPGPGEPDRPIDLKTEVAELERQRVRDALAANGFHQGRAAEALGLSYHQLRGLLRKHGIESRASA